MLYENKKKCVEEHEKEDKKALFFIYQGVDKGTLKQMRSRQNKCEKFYRNLSKK